MKIKLRGFSLVGLMIGLAIFSSMFIVVMQLNRNLLVNKEEITQSKNIVELRALIESVLNNRNFCSVSLAGEMDINGNPVIYSSFRKTSHDNIKSNTEGLSKRLYLSDRDGRFRVKQVLGDNTGFNKFGNIDIVSIKLYFDNNLATPVNYTASNEHYDMATLRIRAQKKKMNFLSEGSKTEDFNLDFPIILKLRTIGSNTDIRSCGRESYQEEEPSGGGCTNNGWYCACNGDTGEWNTVAIWGCYYCNNKTITHYILANFVLDGAGLGSSCYDWSGINIHSPFTKLGGDEPSDRNSVTKYFYNNNSTPP